MKKIITAMSLAMGLMFASAQSATPLATQKAIPVKKSAEIKKTEAKKSVKEIPTITPTITGVKLKKDGTPDKRYKEAKHLKKDGTPDKRYKENQK